LLNSEQRFIALTNVEISPSAGKSESGVSFVAINKEQITLLEELEPGNIKSIEVNKRLEGPEYHKGEWCPYAEKTGRGTVLCQEGFCNRCQIWHDLKRIESIEEAKGEARRVPET